MSEAKTSPFSRKPRRWWLYLLFGPPLLLFFTLAALIILLRTDYGLQRLEDVLNKILSKPLERSIALSGLHGRFPFDLRLNELRLADEHGDWLELSDLALRWSGLDLFSARLRILEVRATRLELLRIPRTDKVEKKAKPWELFQGVDLPLVFPRMAVDRLTLEEIILAEAVAGERTVLQLNADLDAGKNRAQANLRLEVLRGPPGLLAVHAGFVPKTNILSLRAEFSDAKGTLAPLLGLPEATPLSLQVHGDGPLTAWTGTLLSRAGEHVSLESAISLGWQEHPRLAWEGVFSLDASLLPEPANAYLPLTTFQIAATLPAPGQVNLERIILENSHLRAELFAVLNLAQATAQGEVSLVLDTAPLNHLLNVDLGPTIRLDADFSGPFTGPDIRLSLNLHDLSAGQARLASLDLDTQVQVRLKNDPKGQSIATQSHIQAQGLHFSDIATGIAPDVAPGYALPQSLAADFHLEFHRPDNLLDLKSLTLHGDGLKIAEASAKARFSLDKSALSKILARDVLLQAPAFQIRADADFSLRTKELSADARLDLPNLALLAPDAKIGLNGSAFLNAQVSGVLNDLFLDIALTSDDLSLAGLEAFPLQFFMQVESIPAAPAGSASFVAAPMNTPLSGQTAFALRDNIFRFSGLLLNIPEGILHGSGQVNLKTKMITAELQGHITDIFPLATLAKADAQNLRGTLDFQAAILPDKESQSARLRVNLKDFTAGFCTLQSLTIQAQIQNVLAKPRLDATITAQAFHAGKARVDALRTRITGTPQHISLEASARGQALHPFDLNVQAKYFGLQESSQNDPPVHTVHLQGLTGKWADQAIFLSKPLTITQTATGLAISPLTLKFGQATILGQGHLGADSTDLRLGVESLPLSPFTAYVLGTITAGAVLTGPKSALQGDFTLLGHTLMPQSRNGDALPALDLQADARLDNGLVFEAKLQESDAPVTLFQAQGQVPMRLSLSPPALNLPRNAPITASLAGDLNLSWLGTLFLPETQVLAGTLAVDLHLAGTLDDPAPTGTLLLRNGMYQHLLQGVLLRDMTASANLDKNHIVSYSLAATDGAQGTLQGQGEARLLPKENFPFFLSLHANNLNILDNAMAIARVDAASLNISGKSFAQQVQGRIVFSQVEVFLRDFGGMQVVELDVVEINDPEGIKFQKTAKPSTNRKPAPPVKLDLDVQFPARVFVRGRGLDSEWGGGLLVSGKAGAPAVRGDINLLRGRLDFLGKRFTLANGLIQLDGTRPPRPFVTIEARQQGKNITSILRVQGQPPDVAFSLHSEPELPKNEILAQMLFGRSLASITPVQAARLALAARELAGHGGGMDLMGQARDILQLDDLDIVSGEEGGDMRLRAGRYVHERVYLRLEKDLETDDDQVSADVELTPRINLESTIGPKGGGLGLFWKYDY